MRLTEWVFAGYEEFGPDTAVLLTHEAFPDSLDNNRVWQESGRLEQFLENLAAGTPDSLWYGDTGEPLPLLLYKLEFDGESLTRHYYPDPSLPDGVAAEETVPLTWEETGAAVLLREEDGEIWLVWPRYGFERFVPTEEEIAAAAGGAVTEQTVQNGKFMIDNHPFQVSTMPTVSESRVSQVIVTLTPVKTQSEESISVDKLTKRDLESTVYSNYNEQFPALAWIIIVLLIIEVVVLDKKNPLFKNIKLFR